MRNEIIFSIWSDKSNVPKCISIHMKSMSVEKEIWSFSKFFSLLRRNPHMCECVWVEAAVRNVQNYKRILWQIPKKSRKAKCVKEKWKLFLYDVSPTQLSNYWWIFFFICQSLCCHSILTVIDFNFMHMNLCVCIDFI